MSDYKTVGQAAVALDEGKHQEVGETVEEMQKAYDREMRLCLKKNQAVSEYYIVVLRKKEALSIEMPVNNVLRQWFIAPRMSKPSLKVLKKDYPLHDFDVWHVKKGEPHYLITLPGPDAWDTILNNPKDHDPNLVKWMKKFQDDKLDTNY